MTFITTVRLRRCQQRAAESVLSATQLQALPRDENRRITAVSLYVGGAQVAIVEIPRGAIFARKDPEGGPPPELLWRHPDFLLPGHDVVQLVKASLGAMDAAQGTITPPAIEGVEADPRTVAAERPAGRRARREKASA